MAKDRRGSESYEVEWATISIKTIKILVTVVVAAAVFVVYWFWLRGTPSTHVDEPGPVPQESVARFIDYEGKVEVKPKDEYVWSPASFKTDLYDGYRIRTAPDSSARVRFIDGTEITVQSDSIVVIQGTSIQKTQEEQATLVMVEQGESDINAEKSASAPSFSTTKIAQFKLEPGSTGAMLADEYTGDHSSIVNKGHGEVKDVNGTVVRLGDLQQFKIDKNHLTSVARLPRVPPLVSPPNGQVFEFMSDQGITIELKWRDVSNVQRYHVQISESQLFGKLSAEHPNWPKSSIPIKIPKSNKKQYFWRIRSIDQDNNRSPWSEPFQFVVQAPAGSLKLGQGLDKKPPALNIAYIHPFLPFVQVEGTTEPDAFLTLNGQIIDVKDDGSFVFTYTLERTGWNDLVFVAEDPAGNKATVTKKVEY